MLTIFTGILKAKSLKTEHPSGHKVLLHSHSKFVQDFKKVPHAIFVRS